MEREWTSWMQSASQLPTGRVKEASTAQVCDWILRTWNGVKKEVALKSFTKRGISNAVNGTGDGEVYKDEERTLQKTPVMQKLKKTILLIVTVVKTSWPSMTCKFLKFVTST